jgi:hypothetical protein
MMSQFKTLVYEPEVYKPEVYEPTKVIDVKKYVVKIHFTKWDTEHVRLIRAREEKYSWIESGNKEAMQQIADFLNVLMKENEVKFGNEDTTTIYYSIYTDTMPFEKIADKLNEIFKYDSEGEKYREYKIKKR